MIIFSPTKKNHWVCFFWVISLPFREVMVGSLFPVHIMAEIAYPSNKLTQTNSSTTFPFDNYKPAITGMSRWKLGSMAYKPLIYEVFLGVKSTHWSNHLRSDHYQAGSDGSILWQLEGHQQVPIGMTSFFHQMTDVDVFCCRCFFVRNNTLNK